MTASQLLSSGAFVALLPFGFALASAIGIARTRDRLALAVPLGIAAMSLPLVGGALAGHFSAQWNGACGWLLAIGSAVLLVHLRTDRFNAPEPRPVGSHRAIVLAVLGVAAIVYSLAVVESPIGTRDEGVYTMAALALERAGAAEIDGPSAIARASGLFKPFINNIAFYLPGIPFADHLRPQFSPLLPAWIAQLHAVGGDAMLYRFNVMAVVAGAAVFYALARRVVRGSFAVLALTVLALNPAHVWIARINLAEPLGSLFGLAGLLLVVVSLHRPRRSIVVAAVAVLAMAAMVRVDTIIVAPLLIAAAMVLAADDRRQHHARALAMLGVFTLIAQAAAIAILATWSAAYVSEQMPMLVLAPAGSVVALVAYAIIRRQPRSARFAQRRALSAHVMCGLIGAVFVYAAFVRPHIEPFTLIPDRGSMLAGTRDFRENSLRDLAAYIGWPTVVLAVIGVVLTIQSTARRRGSTAAIALSSVALGATVVYLWAPGVSPDHPWAIRRMTTLVIPLTILVAVHGLQLLVAVKLPWRHQRFALTAIPFVVVSLFVMQWPTLRFSENAGLTAQVRALEAELPQGPIIIRGNEGLATTLALGFGRDVLPLRDERVAVDAATRAFWNECRLLGCTLLHESYAGLNGLELDGGLLRQLSRDYLEPTFHPLAARQRHETLNVLQSLVAGIATIPPPSNAGAARDWRLDDDGFYRDELTAGGVARWTRGDATVTLPPSPADRIEIRLASAAPGPMPLRIDIDGVSLFDGMIEPGESRWHFPLAQRSATPHRLRVRSGTFVPAGTKTVGDRRALGVSVRSIRLLAGDPRVLDDRAPTTDFRSHLTVRPIVPASTSSAGAPAFWIDVDNRGSSQWRAVADASPSSEVALGYYWTRVGDSRRVAEQRIRLPYPLAPGEHWSTAMTWDSEAGPLRRLPPGEYELHIGMVLEGVAWFADRGDAAMTIPVTIGVR